jgi:hypothetical protein
MLGDYYVFVFDRDSNIFCLNIGGNRYLPNEMVKRGLGYLANIGLRKNDYLATPMGGYVFQLNPVSAAEAPIEIKIMI